jgi:hypothetical protein
VPVLPAPSHAAVAAQFSGHRASGARNGNTGKLPLSKNVSRCMVKARFPKSPYTVFYLFYFLFFLFILHKIKKEE